MELHNWQESFAENSKKDHEDIMNSLNEVKTGQQLLLEASNKSSEEIAQIMLMMQGVSSTANFGLLYSTDISLCQAPYSL